MVAASKVREEMKRLVEERIPLDEFEDWIVGQSWNMHADVDADPVAKAIVSSVELRLAEHSSGHLPFQQMLDEFRSLLVGFTALRVSVNADPSVGQSGVSVKHYCRVDQVQLLQSAGISPLRVYA